ncbi:MAG: hypothetical protein J5736_02120, partial [Bacilli bacterium]|nr:hypothetical protein [Bacilli bacterium]
DELRRYYQRDNREGALLYTELFLYGFSFHCEFNLGFYPPDCDPDGPVIISADKNPFPLGNVKNKKLRKLFRDLEVMVYSDVNGMYYDRLQRFLGLRGISEMLRSIGFAITAWSKLDMENFGARFLYWPVGREGLALPNFFLPFYADLISASPSLLSFYDRLGFKRFEDFLHLNFGRVEYLSRLIAKQGMSAYEAGLHQVALWAFVYRLEEAKRALNEVDLDLRFLFLPIPQGLYKEQEEVLRKYLLISLPFGHSLSLAEAYARGDLPPELENLRTVLADYGIRNLIPWTVFLLQRRIKTYSLAGSMYREANDPSLALEGAITLLKNGAGLSLGIADEEERRSKIADLLAKNDPEKALAILFAQKVYLPLEALKKIPGMVAYLKSGESSYGYDEETGLAGTLNSLKILEKRKRELFFFPHMIPFEEILHFYEESGASPLLYLEEKAVALEYDPFPRLLLPKRKAERLERGIPEYGKWA